MRLHFSCYCHLIRIVLNMQDLVAVCSFVSVNYVSPQVHLPLKYDLVLPLAVACIYQHNLLQPPSLIGGFWLQYYNRQTSLLNPETSISVLSV